MMRTGLLQGPTVILKVAHSLVFRGGPDFRAMSTQSTTLGRRSAKNVVFNEIRQGYWASVARSLEAPSDKPEVFTDEKGNPTAVAKIEQKKTPA